MGNGPGHRPGPTFSFALIVHPVPQANQQPLSTTLMGAHMPRYPAYANESIKQIKANALNIRHEIRG